ncbi:MAG: hypothetical protein Q8J72_12650 [Rhodocyclaceae bacterium]|nr:hypothetical protein [Rhodocyclaceae bacterium]MDP2196818.1 hypothetical protein [Rhodocyclaceae bacterium]
MQATLDQVALALGISRQRAYQIEAVAMNKFRRRFAAKLQEYGIEVADLLAACEAKDNAAVSMLGKLAE